MLGNINKINIDIIGGFYSTMSVNYFQIRKSLIIETTEVPLLIFFILIKLLNSSMIVAVVNETG